MALPDGSGLPRLMCPIANVTYYTTKPAQEWNSSKYS